MSTEDGTFVHHYDEWIPLEILVPAPGTLVDLLWIEPLRTRKVYAVRWPHPGDWLFWKQRTESYNGRYIRI